MPITSHPIEPKNKKTETKSQVDKIIKTLGDSDVFKEQDPLPAQEGDASSKNINTTESVEPKEAPETDSRKEFFRLMAEKIKDKDFNINNALAMKAEVNRVERGAAPGEPEPDESQGEGVGGGDDIVEEGLTGDSEFSDKSPRSAIVYKKIVSRFVFLAVVLLLIVLYFSLVKLNIVVYSEKNSVDGNLNFYAQFDGERINLERAIESSINRIEIEERGEFVSSGEKNLDGEIVGSVRIVNNYSKNQPLVATTRLLSSDDKLYRIKETVNVPAGGYADVAIYTDEVSEEMAIGPDKFIIPGLWSGIQDKIYAESSEAFKFEKNSKKYIMEKDVNAAIEELKEKMIAQAEEKLKSSVDPSHQHAVNIDLDSLVVNTDKNIGDEAEEFSVSLKAPVSIISFKTSDVVDLAKKKMTIESNQSISEIDANSLSYELVNIDISKGLAEIRGEFIARTLAGSDNFVNKKYLSNLNKRQIEVYLDNIEEIKSYELNFTPRFIKRSPFLVDKINIEYK